MTNGPDGGSSGNVPTVTVKPDAKKLPAHKDMVISDAQRKTPLQIFDEKGQPVNAHPFDFKIGSKLVTTTFPGLIATGVTMSDLTRGISGLLEANEKEEPLEVPDNAEVTERRKKYLMRSDLVDQNGWGIAAGDEVEHLQRMLNGLVRRGKLDPPILKENGKFDGKTEEAVKNFQKQFDDWDEEKVNPRGQKDDRLPRVKLEVDGRVGERTADAINRAVVGIFSPSYVNYRKNTAGNEIGLLTLAEAGKNGRITSGKPPIKMDSKILLQVIGKIPTLEANYVWGKISHLGNAVPNIAIIIKNSTAKFKVVTDREGIFRVKNVPKGNYEVLVEDEIFEVKIQKLEVK